MNYLDIIFLVHRHLVMKLLDVEIWSFYVFVITAQTQWKYVIWYNVYYWRRSKWVAQSYVKVFYI